MGYYRVYVRYALFSSSDEVRELFDDVMIENRQALETTKIPLSGFPYGFAIVVRGMAVILVILLLLFKRLKWF